MPSPSTASGFQTYSRKVAANFLQTVVVVDDRPETIVRPKTDPAPVQATAIIAPVGRGSRGGAVAPAAPTGAAGGTAPAGSFEPDENLYIKNLNEAFAEKGIICGVLRPLATLADRRKIISAAEQAAKRADIVILDWKMEGETEEGATALQIIEGVFKGDNAGRDTPYQEPGRLRLIAVYSQNPDLPNIIDRIAASLSAQHFTRENPYTIVQESVRICAFKKKGGLDQSMVPGLGERILDEEALTEKLIDEFTLLTQGLLSNVAINSLSSIRENTHRILQKFDNKLDPSYLTHRALTNPVDETESHPIALIASEIHDVLAGTTVSEAVSEANIKLWIAEMASLNTLDAKVPPVTHDEVTELLTNLVVNGIDAELKKSGTGPAAWAAFLKTFERSAKDGTSKLTSIMLAASDATSKDRDRNFSMLTTIRSHYEHPAPQLGLGSIAVAQVNNKPRYFVCIQPLCDSVRLQKERKFPFLWLEPHPSIFDLVVKTEGKHQGLRVNYKPSNMEMFLFAPKKKVISAEKEDDKWVFSGKDGAGNEIKLTWLADLKFPHAQRIAAQFGGNISRVGLSESEWLRRMALGE